MLLWQKVFASGYKSRAYLQGTHDVAGLVGPAGGQQLGYQLPLALLGLVTLHGSDVLKGPAAAYEVVPDNLVFKTSLVPSWSCVTQSVRDPGHTSHLKAV